MSNQENDPDLDEVDRILNEGSSSINAPTDVAPNSVSNETDPDLAEVDNILAAGTTPTSNSDIPMKRPEEDLNITPGIPMGIQKMVGGLATAVIPEKSKEVYEFAKKGKSVFEKGLYPSFVDKTMKASDDVVGNLNKVIDSFGSAIGAERTAAEAAGKKFNISSTLKELEDTVNVAIKKEITDPMLQRQAKNFLKQQLEPFKSDLKSTKLSIAKPENPILDTPEQIAAGKLQSKLNAAKGAEILKGGSAVEGKSGKAGNKLIQLLHTYKQGKSTPFTKAISESIPEGVSNPIDIITNTTIDKVYNNEVGPKELKSTIDSLKNQAKATKDPVLKNYVEKSVKKLIDIENTMSPKMSALKKVYGEAKDVAELVPGMSGYYGDGTDYGSRLSLKNKAPSQTKNFIKDMIMSQGAEGPSPRDILSRDITSRMSNLEDLTSQVPMGPPTSPILSPVEDLADEASRVRLSREVGAGTDATSELAEQVTRVNKANVVARNISRIADTAGKITKEFPVATKVVGKAAKYGLPALSMYSLIQEAKDAGLSDEEAAQYAAALSAVDVGAVEGGLAVAKKAPGIIPKIALGGAALLSPIVREVRGAFNPEASMDKLKLYKQLKKQGLPNAAAMAGVTAAQAKETIMAIPGGLGDIGGAVADLFNPSKGVVKNYSDDKLQNAAQQIDSSGNKSYNQYKDLLLKASETPDRGERKAIMFNLQQQPAFRQMMENLKIQADE